MHHWPVWGRERILEMLRKGRDAYRFINDETLRLANHGHTPVEIAEMVELPDGARAPLGRARLLRHGQPQRQGDLRQVPRRLRRQPGEPAPAAADRVGAALRRADGRRRRASWSGPARRSTAGEYRWVAELVNHVVFAEPGNEAARELQADTLEQLGYQAESGPWRNAYLTGRQGAALRHARHSRRRERRRRTRCGR